jgi:hypothetical protein
VSLFFVHLWAIAEMKNGHLSIIQRNLERRDVEKIFMSKKVYLISFHNSYNVYAHMHIYIFLSADMLLLIFNMVT